MSFLWLVKTFWYLWKELFETILVWNLVHRPLLKMNMRSLILSNSHRWIWTRHLHLNCPWPYFSIAILRRSSRPWLLSLMLVDRNQKFAWKSCILWPMDVISLSALLLLLEGPTFVGRSILGLMRFWDMKSGWFWRKLIFIMRGRLQLRWLGLGCNFLRFHFIFVNCFFLAYWCCFFRFDLLILLSLINLKISSLSPIHKDH